MIRIKKCCRVGLGRQGAASKETHLQQQPCQLMCLQHLSDLIFGSPPAQEELICRVPGALHCQKGLNSGTLHGCHFILVRGVVQRHRAAYCPVFAARCITDWRPKVTRILSVSEPTQPCCSHHPTAAGLWIAGCSFMLRPCQVLTRQSTYFAVPCCHSWFDVELTIYTWQLQQHVLCCCARRAACYMS